MSLITKETDKKRTRLTLWRRITQTLFVFLLNPYFFSFRQICFPVLNCWGCPISAFSCPIGALGQFFAHGVFPFIVLGSILIFGVIIGRMLCGWACPFGFLQDIIYKIPSRKVDIPALLNYGKYVILAVMVVLIPIFWGIDLTPDKTTPENFFFCNLCPGGTLEATIPLAIIDANITDEKADESSINTPDQRFTALSGGKNILVAFLKSPRFWILVLLLITFIFISRPFCRVFCPIGGIFALFNKVSFYKMFLNKTKCTECEVCYKVCPTVHKMYQHPNSAECIRCLDCEEKCPTEAIENKYF